MHKPVICLMGPTASGKTGLAIELATRFPVEIISVDSAMIYRGMDIGSAKPSPAEQAIAPHHLIDIIDPPDSFSVAQFRTQALSLIASIHQAQKIPLLVGGTMMYFNALQKGLSALPDANETIRRDILERAEREGWDALHQALMAVDPISAARIHAHDTQRIQRALEVFYVTNKPLSLLQTENQSEALALAFHNMILFPDDRAWLHERIAARLALMCQQGFIQEVEQILSDWPLSLASPALRCVGYRQAALYLQGEYDYATFTDKALAATRQLAKRQLTWLRHWGDGRVIPCDAPRELDRVVEYVQKILDNR